MAVGNLSLAARGGRERGRRRKGRRTPAQLRFDVLDSSGSCLRRHDGLVRYDRLAGQPLSGALSVGGFALSSACASNDTVEWPCPFHSRSDARPDTAMKSPKSTWLD